MLRSIRDRLRKTELYKAYKARKEETAIKKWEESGRPAPPPHKIKQQVVKDYSIKFSIHILVETGTYLGDMVFATKDMFSRIYSIELAEVFYKRAVERFAPYAHIRILEGDSAAVLPSILKEINEPTLFWLDGHYSGGDTGKGEHDTPILKELEYIFAHHISDHVILVDDARCFVGENDYPTIDALKRYVLSNREGWIFEVNDDIIRIHKPII